MHVNSMAGAYVRLSLGCRFRNEFYKYKFVIDYWDFYSRLSKMVIAQWLMLLLASCDTCFLNCYFFIKRLVFLIRCLIASIYVIFYLFKYQLTNLIGSHADARIHLVIAS